MGGGIGFNDFWLFQYVAKIILEGKTLYIDAFEHKSPLIFFLNIPFYQIFGETNFARLIITTLIPIADTFLFFLVSRKIFKQDIFKTNLSVLIYVFYRNLAQIMMPGNNTENFFPSFILLGILSYFKFKENLKNSYLILTGIFISLLFFLKPNFIIFTLPFFIDLFNQFFHTNKWRLIKSILILILPIFVQFIFWYLYFYNQNATNEFFIASFQFNSVYFENNWRIGINESLAFWIRAFPLFLPIILYLSLYFSDFKRIFKLSFEKMLILINGIILFLYVAPISSVFYPYYMLPIIPFFSLLITDKIIIPIKGVKLVFLYILIICSIILWSISTKQIYNTFLGQTKNEIEENNQIANFIKTNTDENETIFAYSYGTIFYYLSNRQAATRFLSANHLLIDYRNNNHFNFSDICIADLEKNKPNYIIFLKDSIYGENKILVDYIFSHYTAEKNFPSYLILKRKN